MKYISTVIVLFAFVSCTGDLKQYQKPENGATTSEIIDIYEGMTDIMRDNPLKTMQPGDIVYLAGDTAIGNGVVYLKICWGDTSAYMDAGHMVRLEEWNREVAELEEFNNQDNGDPGNDMPSESDLRNEMVQEQPWTSGADVQTPEQSPGKINKYFVFEDGTEMPAEGYELENLTPWRAEDPENNDKTVKKVRFEVVLQRNVDLIFDVTTYFGPNSEYNTSFTKRHENCEAGKSYSVEIEEEPGSMILCSVLRVSMTTGEETAVATVSGSCGD